MPRLTASITAAAPPEAVFGVIESPDGPLLPEGGPRLIKLGTVTGVGAQYRWQFRLLGLTFSADSVVTEYRPGQRIAYRGTTGWTMECVVDLVPAEGGTRLEFRMRYRFPAPVRWLVPGTLIRRGIFLALNRVKEIAEASIAS